MNENENEKEKKNVDNKEAKYKEDSKYCTCNGCYSVYADTESNDFGYWLVCTNCNKKIEDEFHYYNHYDGEDHDDIDLYCDDNF